MEDGKLKMEDGRLAEPHATLNSELRIKNVHKLRIKS
jgi:hypothetical protein